MTNQATLPKYLDKREVAILLGVDRRTVDRLRERGIIKAIRLSSTLIRFDAEAVRQSMLAATEK